MDNPTMDNYAVYSEESFHIVKFDTILNEPLYIAYHKCKTDEYKSLYKEKDWLCLWCSEAPSRNFKDVCLLIGVD
jgi:hypothetical protein